MNTPDTLTLLRTQSLTNLVQEELERRIVAGQLTPGAPLREAAIAAEMGISRGPVREAFRMLEERGLVLFEKNCGVRYGGWIWRKRCKSIRYAFRWRNWPARWWRNT